MGFLLTHPAVPKSLGGPVAPPTGLGSLSNSSYIVQTKSVFATILANARLHVAEIILARLITNGPLINLTWLIG